MVAGRQHHVAINNDQLQAGFPNEMPIIDTAKAHAGEAIARPTCSRSHAGMSSTVDNRLCAGGKGGGGVGAARHLHEGLRGAPVDDGQ